MSHDGFSSHNVSMLIRKESFTSKNITESSSTNAIMMAGSTANIDFFSHDNIDEFESCPSMGALNSV